MALFYEDELEHDRRIPVASNESHTDRRGSMGGMTTIVRVARSGLKQNLL